MKLNIFKDNYSSLFGHIPFLAVLWAHYVIYYI